MSNQPCPRCNSPTSELLDVEAGMKLGLQEAGQLDGVPEKVCPRCYTDLGRYVSQGARLRAERKAKDANRINLWRNRVKLVKDGRRLMTQKAFPEAAIAYEKYLKVLDVVYDCKPGELKPELFKNTARSKELMVISSVLWDLMRIYDTHPRYTDRQKRVADQLARFSKGTPVFKDIVRQALSFSAKAKNKDVFKSFLKACDAKTSRCFIATASFEDGRHPQVQTLCRFRDQVLRHSPLGRRFIKYYYKYSPKIAEQIDRHKWLKILSRESLRIVANLLSWSFNLKSTHDQ